jgi:hypothetical protein
MEALKQSRESDQKLMNTISSYFDYLATMSSSRRAMLEASVAVVMLGLGMVEHEQRLEKSDASQGIVFPTATCSGSIGRATATWATGVL